MSPVTPDHRTLNRATHELLIVDGDAASRQATLRPLSEAGFRTREAATVTEALSLALALAGQADTAIVLDLRRADLDGLALCRHLRADPRTARLPVLQLSAASGNTDRLRGIDAGADACLTHPIEPEVLVAAVDALVRQRVAEATLRRSEGRSVLAALERERDARTRAEHAARMKDEFIAVLAHELRSPLNAMMGWTHVLLRRGGSESQMQALAAIQRNGEAQERLISDLLDMSSLDAGKLRLTRTALDPLEIVQMVVTSLEGAARDNGNAVVLHAGPQLPQVEGDSVRLQQVVWNLLGNAIKFSPRGAPIELRVAATEGGVLIAVRDRGRGIDAALLPRIFERFTQGDSATRRFRSGLGIGLSIVQQLAQAHGGRVAASSDGVGQGAVFEVWLPALAPAGADVPAPAADEPETRLDAPLLGLRVLVVEDDAEALAVLKAILGDRGASVAGARSVDEALALLPEFAPQLLLSDIGLPGKDGHQLIAEVRRREAASGAARLPAIALTAFSQTSDRASALAGGFDVHCSKPVRPLLLVRTIGDLVPRGAAAAEARLG